MAGKPKSKPADEQVSGEEKEKETKGGAVVVVCKLVQPEYPNGREFSEEEHGENYKKLAEEYAEKFADRGCQVVKKK